MIDVYHKGSFHPAMETLFEKIEDALGFKLFIWQKTFIAYGKFRYYGETTAYVLGELLQVDGPPIDYTIRPRSNQEAIYRKELIRTKEKLSRQGIETRTIFLTEFDKRKYSERNNYSPNYRIREDYI